MTTSLGLKQRIATRFKNIKEKIKTKVAKAKQISIEKRSKIAKKHSSVNWPVVAGVVLGILFIIAVIILIFGGGDGGGDSGSDGHGSLETHNHSSLEHISDAIDVYDTVKGAAREAQLKKEEEERKNKTKQG